MQAPGLVQPSSDSSLPFEVTKGSRSDITGKSDTVYYFPTRAAAEAFAAQQEKNLPPGEYFKWTFTATENPGAQLGWLSKRYEVGKNGGPGTVSSGKGDKGGVSYGTYQLSSNEGTAQRFVDSSYAKDFKGRKPGTADFNAKWKELASANPTEFQARQHQFIQETHYDPAAAKLNKDLGLNVNARSFALQNVLWSTSVQHGGNGGAKLVEKALQNVLKEKSVAQLTDAEIINAIYDERGRTDSSGKLVRFKSSSTKVQDSVKARYQQERKDALAELAGEQSSSNTPSSPLP
jgi:hypothetical protein